jgi:hypothetical protein
MRITWQTGKQDGSGHGHGQVRAMLVVWDRGIFGIGWGRFRGLGSTGGWSMA